MVMRVLRLRDAKTASPAGRGWVATRGAPRSRVASPPMVVAIDGPAGAGKSTVARALAEALGFTYLDSGAMYRAVALQSLRSGRPAPHAARTLDTALLASPDIRTPGVSEAASKVATDPAVRAALVELQREL